MVETITPMVHGGSRARWGAAVALHTAAATAVAGAFGAGLALAGLALGAPWGGAGWVLVAAVAVAATAHELAGTPFPVPQLRRQVPDWWRTFFGPFPAAALYGAALGVGFLTFVTRATLVVIAVAVAVSGRPLVGAALMAPFGLARGLAATVAGAGSRPGTIERLARIGSSRLVAAANGVAAALVAVAAFAARPTVAAEGYASAAAAGLAVVFAWSGLWKLLRYGRWRRVLSGHGFGGLEPLVSRVVPAVEGLVPILVVARQPRAAAALALGIVAAGSIAIVRARILLGPKLACGCFDATARDYLLLLARNAAIAALAVAALRAPAGGRGIVPGLASADLVPVALAAVGAIALVWAVVSVRRILRRWVGDAR